MRITRKMLETEVREVEKRWLKNEVSLYPHQSVDLIVELQLQELNGFYRIVAKTAGGGGYWSKPNGAPDWSKARELWAVMPYL